MIYLIHWGSLMLLFRGFLGAFYTLAPLLIYSSAWAFNGTQLPGLGVNQVGMAGAGTALLSNAAATLRNPASGVFMESGSTWDLAVGIPNAGYAAGSTGPDSRMSLFEYEQGQYQSVSMAGFAPSFAKLWRLSDQWAWGLGLYGAGMGSNMTDGAANIARGIPGLSSECDGDYGGGGARNAATNASQCGDRGGKAGIQLTQINLGVFLGYRPSEWLGIGVTPLLGLQQFRIQGLSAFAPYSTDPPNVTDRDQDYSWGVGYRLGLHIRPTQTLEMGLSYQPTMRQSHLDRYAGAMSAGRLNIPANLNAGLHWEFAPGHSLLLDWDQVRYDQVRPLAASPQMDGFVNQCILPRLLGAAAGQENPDYCLGGKRGPGFGWGKMTMQKLGYEYRRDRWQWRMGYSRGGSPIRTLNALMTVLAPAVGSEHIAAGFTWDCSARLSVGVALSYAMDDTKTVSNELSNISIATPNSGQLVDAVTGEAALIQLNVGQDADDQNVRVHMEIWQVQVGLNWRLQEFH